MFRAAKQALRFAKTGSRQCQIKQWVGWPLADKSRKLLRVVNGKILGIGKRRAD